MYQDKWLELYKKRLLERGIDSGLAKEIAKNCEIDLLSDPSDAADEELSYWGSDG